MDERDVNQDVVAEAAGVSQPAVSSWKKGKSLPQKRENWARLAAFFGVSENWLRDGGDRENISSDIKTDLSRLKDMPADASNLYSDLSTETLKKMFAEISSKIPTAAQSDCKYKLGQVRAILDELESREMVGELAGQAGKKAVEEVKHPGVIYGGTRKLHGDPKKGT